MLKSLTIKASMRCRCLYRNETKHPQIARISQGTNQDFERVIFPAQVIVFEALPEDELEIYSCEVATALLSDRILCHQLITSDLKAIN